MKEYFFNKKMECQLKLLFLYSFITVIFILVTNVGKITVPFEMSAAFGLSVTLLYIFFAYILSTSKVSVNANGKLMLVYDEENLKDLPDLDIHDEQYEAEEEMDNIKVSTIRKIAVRILNLFLR